MDADVLAAIKDAAPIAGTSDRATAAAIWAALSALARRRQGLEASRLRDLADEFYEFAN